MESEKRPKTLKTALTALILLILLNNSSAEDSNIMSLSWGLNLGGIIQSNDAFYGDIIYVASSNGRLYAINRTAGEVIWSFNAKKPIYTSFTMAEDRFYFGTLTGKIYAVNRSGQEVWNYGADSKIVTTPVYSDGLIYICSYEKTLYAINASKGRLVWKFTAPNQIINSIKVSGDIIYIPSDQTIIALNKNTGEEIWRNWLKAKIMEVIADDKIYVSLQDRLFLPSLDPNTGEIIQDYTLSAKISSGMILTPETIIYGSHDKKIHSTHRLSGMDVWTHELQATSQSMPLRNNGILYFPSNDKKLSAIRESDGREEWVYTARGSIISKPLMDGDSIYITSNDGSIYVLGHQPDLVVTDIDYDGTLLSDQEVSIDVEVLNNGSGIASNMIVAFYVDRNLKSRQSIFLKPGGKKILSFPWYAQTGTHLIEILLNKAERKPESDETNNNYGVLVTSTQHWPKYKHDWRNTGFTTTSDPSHDMRWNPGWICSLTDDKGRTWTDYQMKNGIAFLWTNYMESIYLDPNSLNMTLSCSAGSPFTGPMNARLYCGVRNQTLPGRQFAAMKQYINSFNQAEYNAMLSNGTLIYPFNITAFNFTWDCYSPFIDELPLPVINYSVSWECRPKNNFKYTPKNHVQAWACGFSLESVYPLKDVAENNGYGMHLKSRPIRHANATDYGLLWRFNAGAPVKSSPVITDVDDDGFMELIVGSDDGGLYSLNHLGALKWVYRTGGPVRSTPLVIDLEGDGRFEVIFGSNDGMLYCLNDKGMLKWSFKTNGQITSSPISVNADETPQSEVIVGSWDGNVYAIKHDGKMDWAYKTQGTVQSSPTLLDVNGDGKLEIVVGSGDNNLYAINYPPYLMWTYSMNDDITSTPLIADLKPYTPNIIVSSDDGSITELYRKTLTDLSVPVISGGVATTRKIKQSKLEKRWFLETGSRSYSSPSVANLDLSGGKELVYNSGNNLYILNKNGKILIRMTMQSPTYSSPALADLDNDKNVDIIQGSDDGLLYVIENGSVRMHYATGGHIRSSPAVADLNNDGYVDIAFGSDDGWVYVLGYGSSVRMEVSNVSVSTDFVLQEDSIGEEVELDDGGLYDTSSVTVEDVAEFNESTDGVQLSPDHNVSGVVEYPDMPASSTYG
ncbi:MAG: PQQ-binding-like beta-propeller repeat protein [Candidatus Altiarchaeota archaeon]